MIRYAIAIRQVLVPRGGEMRTDLWTATALAAALCAATAYTGAVYQLDGSKLQELV